MIGGNLIGRGSFGCVFKPELQCKGSNKTISDNNVSKIFFGKDSLKEAKEELKVDSIIQKIPNYDDWCHIWTNTCKPQSYGKILKNDKSVKECIRKAKIKEKDFDKQSHMLQGTYAGIVLSQSLKREFTKEVFKDKNKFKKEFLKVMVRMKSLFLGLKELHKHKICHLDISKNNITFDGEAYKFIDFGMSCKFSEKNKFMNRSKAEFAWDRVYPPYPYEFFYLHAPLDLLKEERDDKKHHIYRTGHDSYELIQDVAFRRKHTQSYLVHLCEKFMNDIKIHSGKEGALICSLLDIYSLGYLIPKTLIELAPYTKDSELKKKMHDLFEIPEVHQFMHLFKQMTQPDAINRITPEKAYDKYIELEKIYLQDFKKDKINKKENKDKRDKKGNKNKKRTKRRKK